MIFCDNPNCVDNEYVEHVYELRIENKFGSSRKEIRRVRDNKLHGVELPAVVYEDGSESWYCDGFLHRFVGPARTVVCGNEKRVYLEFWRHGKLLGTNGPAIGPTPVQLPNFPHLPNEPKN